MRARQRPQPDAAAHRMGHQEPRLRQAFGAGKGQNRVHIQLIFGKIADMAGVCLIQRPVGKPLTAHINRQRGLAPRRQITRRAAVFFDIFRAAGQQEHRPLGPVMRPDADANMHTVHRRQLL